MISMNEKLLPINIFKNYLTIIVAILLIILSGIGLSYVNEQVRKDRCYELTPQDFYKTKTCQKYVEGYEDD